MGHTLTGLLALGAVLLVLLGRRLERTAPRRGCARRRCPSATGGALVRNVHSDSAAHRAPHHDLAHHGSSHGGSGNGPA